jgi:hypothetical protein
VVPGRVNGHSVPTHFSAAPRPPSMAFSLDGTGVGEIRAKDGGVSLPRHFPRRISRGGRCGPGSSIASGRSVSLNFLFSPASAVQTTQRKEIHP